MSINVSGNIISSTGFTTSSEIANTSNNVTSGLVLWLDAGNNASYTSSSSYYDCGYGCQYYGSDPGCSNCNAQIKDMSGNGYDGILSGATIVYGNMGGSILLNGSSNFVEVASDGYGKFNFQSYTIDAWCKFDTLSQDVVIFSYDFTSSVNPYYSAHLRISNYDVIYFMWNDGSTYQYLSKTSATLDTINYHHIVGVYTSGDQRLYVDGSLVNSSSRTDTITFFNQEVWIGKGTYGGFFDGNIASVRYYSKALTANEVLQNFDAGRQRFGI